MGNKINVKHTTRETLLGQYLVTLLSDVLKDRIPQECPADISFHELFEYAKFQGVANIAYYGIEKLEQRPDQELMEQWKMLKEMTVLRSLRQDSELQLILKAFTKENIPVLPLKGAVLRGYYPQLDYRFMSDIDLLIKQENMNDVNFLFNEKGYTCELLDQGTTDVYKKKPLFNFEVHRAVFSENLPFHEYFHPEKMWNRAVMKAGHQNEYELKPNDFYVYMMAHFYKHYQGSGSGIRSVMDIHIYQTAFKHLLNEHQLESIFQEIGLNDFRKKVESIAEKWFNLEKDFENIERLEENLFRHGLYGTYEGRIENQVEKMQGHTYRYLRTRVFPGLAFMSIRYPILKKAPLLLPVFWLVRISAGFFKRRSKNLREIRYALTLKKQQKQREIRKWG